MAKPKKAPKAKAQSKKTIRKTKDSKPENKPIQAGTKSKPGKARVTFESSLGRLEAVTYFDAIVAGLRKGALNFKQGEDSIAFALPEQVEIEVKAERKKGKENISFEMTWQEQDPADDNELKISSS